MKKIILIGGGGHCASVIDVIEQENKFKIAGIIDKSSKIGKKLLGYHVIGEDSDLQSLSKKYNYALVTVGQIKSPKLRIKLFEKILNAGFQIPTIISPRAYVAQGSSIGKGTVIMHDALINNNSFIGKNCIINSKALVEHDVVIEDHCHISTNAIINGEVRLCKESFIGSGSIIADGRIINSNSFIKAGSLYK